MQIISTQPWRAGRMPGWSSSTPAGEKTFACFRGHRAACLHLLTDCFQQAVIAQVRLLPKPVTDFQGACRRNGKLARRHSGDET